MGGLLPKVETGESESEQTPPKIPQAEQALEKDSNKLSEQGEATAKGESSDKIESTAGGELATQTELTGKGESVAKAESADKEDCVAKGDSSHREQPKEDISELIHPAEVKLVDSHTEPQQMEDNKAQMTEKKIQAKNIALLVEASKIPLPPSPYGDSKTTSVIKNREGPQSAAESSGKLEAPGAPEVVPSAPGDHKIVDVRGSETTAAMPEPMTDDVEVKKNLEIKLCEEEKKREDLKNLSETIPTVNENNEKRVEHMTAECQMIEEAKGETKDMAAQQEMKVPVEELAEQLSQVVISTAAKELCPEKKVDVKEMMKMEITTVDNSNEQENLPQDSNKEDRAKTSDAIYDDSDKVEKHETKDIITDEAQDKTSDKKDEEYKIPEST